MKLFKSRIVLILLLVITLFSCSSGGGNSDDGNNTEFIDDRILLGAHYYQWFPRNFSQGYLREKLSPPHSLLLGEYNSLSDEIIRQQINSASRAGIDFFTIDFWPNRTGFREGIDKFLEFTKGTDFKFAIFYELWDLGFDSETQATIINDSDRRTLINNFAYFCKNYFSSDNYLKVNGRPVVYLYLTRTLVGNYKPIINQLRENCKNEGFDIFLIADEIYWFVKEDLGNGSLIDSPEPNRERALTFDALFYYNPYAPSLTQHSGFGKDSAYISDINSLVKRYRDNVPEVPIVPMVMPGYNDRGVRSDKNHFVIPRQWSSNESVTSFFENMFRRHALKNIDSRLPMVLITSWNEWNEDTAIEATESFKEDLKTNQPASLTEGFSYEPYGEGYLESIRNLTRG